MRLKIRRRRRVPEPQRLLELVVPGRNESGISAAEGLLGALALPRPFALEIAGNHLSPWFSMRTSGEAMTRQLKRQLGARYTQARWRDVPLDDPEADPALLRNGEQMAACALDLRGPEYLPLRMWTDRDLGDDARGQAGDPLLAVLAAVREVPPGWRALAQVLLLPTRGDWSSKHRGRQEEARRSRDGEVYDTNLMPVCLSIIGAFDLVLAWLGIGWYVNQDVLQVAAAGAGIAGSAPLALAVMRHFAPDPPADPELVRQKITLPGCRAQLRLAVYAPLDASKDELQQELQQLAGAYGHFNLAIGNGLAARSLKGPIDLRRLEPAGKLKVLNIRELAGLWHLPHGCADVPLLERTAYRRILPRPDQVSAGCRIGLSEHQDVRIPVHLPHHVLDRHLLLAAKTRYGKSSLLLRLLEYLMQPDDGWPERPALLLVDPHGDLARAVLGVIPESRRGDVIYLDGTNQQRPFGLNPLDVGLGWSRDEVTENVVNIMKRQWESSWGSRMENSLRFALVALYEANQAMCADDRRNGYRRQYTLLDLMPFLMDSMFRDHVLKSVTDPLVRQWWKNIFENFDRRTQIDSVAPTVTKIGRFGSSEPASAIIGQACSTIQPADWLRSGAIVIVNLSSGELGPGTAALIGATLLNFVKNVILRQVRLDPAERKRLLVVVDEFHTIPGAEYETYLSELGKYGASLVLATQNLEKLDTMDQVRRASLRSDVFANIGGLVSFCVSATDGKALLPELGPPVVLDDLVSLPQWDCYVRFAPQGGALSDGQPVFSMRLDKPPTPDRAVAEELAAASAAVFGRDGAAVRRDIQAAVNRVDQLRQQLVQQAMKLGKGVPKDLAADATPLRLKRTQHHQGRRTKAGEAQPALLGADGAADDEQAGADSEGEPEDEPTHEEGDR